METALYCLARALVALLQALPLTWVARLGRAGRRAGLLAGRAPPARGAAQPDHVLRRGEIAGRAPRPGARELPAHRRELRLRHQDRRHELRRAAAAGGVRRQPPDPLAPRGPEAAERRRRHRPLRELRALCPLRPVCARLQVRHHLPRFAPAFPQPAAAIAARAFGLPLL